MSSRHSQFRLTPLSAPSTAAPTPSSSLPPMSQVIAPSTDQGTIPPPGRQAHFYLPSSQCASASETSSSLPSSRQPSVPVSPVARPLSSHHRSRSSVAHLRSALEAYHVPPASSSATDPASMPPSSRALPGGLVLQPRTPSRFSSGDPSRTRSGSALDVNHVAEGLGQEKMDALVEIHRVLYRGREDRKSSEARIRWADQGKEVKRVIDRWFEGDCVYDHPLLRVSSRQSLLSHFMLLHLLSDVHLPSLRPSSVMEHAKQLSSEIRRRLLRRGHDKLSSVEAGSTLKLDIGKAKGKMVDEWLGLPDVDRVTGKGSEGDLSLKDDDWWRLWDVSADCREIGGMECYDGYHLAMIEHVVRFTLFPSLARAKTSEYDFSSTSSIASLNLSAVPHGSFLSRLAVSLAEEFEYLLHWDLPISTMVEFNEVGRATRVKDVIDVRDVVETFVPFAKRIGWLTRRVSGMLTSTIGSIALSCVPIPAVTTAPTREPDVRETEILEKPFLAGSIQRFASQLGSRITSTIGVLPSQSQSSRDQPTSCSSSEHEVQGNLLGLQGMSNSSMAPDIDSTL